MSTGASEAVIAVDLRAKDGLPEGWELVKLPDVCDLNPPKPPPDALPPDAEVTFVPMPAVDAERGAISGAVLRSFSQVRKGYTSFRDGDVIMAKITPCMENGKAAIACGLENGLGFGSTEFHVLRSNGRVLREFPYHFIRQESFRKTAESEMTGSVGQKRVPASFLENVEIPLPPLAEQKRIVAKIEELLAQVSSTRERLAKVPAMLKRFRQAVLSAAGSGRLTEDWRGKNGSQESGEELLQRILTEKRVDSTKRTKFPGDTDRPELADTWTWAPVGDITSNFDGRRIPVKSDDRKKRRGPYPYYGASGVIDSIDDYLFDGEFLLIAEDGANLEMRSTPIAFRANGRFWVNNHAHVVQTYGGIPLDYLEGYLNSMDLQDYITGSAQPKLTQANMNRIPVPLPPVAEQVEIVRRVEALFRLAETIKKRVSAATARVERLTQAILAKAFRGELVPTEAELARREGRAYESASALVARILGDRNRDKMTKKESQRERL